MLGDGTPKVLGFDVPTPHSGITGGGAPSLAGAASLWESSHAVSIWQRMTVACLALISMVCVHYVFYHLHTIMIPFFLSALIVFALQPSVECLYQFLAGLSAPFRWFGCCCQRRKKFEEADIYGTCCFSPVKRRRSSSSMPNASRATVDEEALNETEPLLEQVPALADSIGEGFARFMAVCVALSFLFGLSMFFFLLLGHGALHMKENWAVYQRGLARVEHLQDALVNATAHELGLEETIDQHFRDAYDHVLEQAQEMVWVLMNELIKGASEGVAKVFIVLLYVMFWLMQPLPTGGKVSTVVRSYLWKKALVSFLYGGCVTLLFFWLKIDLALFFGIISFFLNFVPEVGAFISMIVPVPVIILDGRLNNPGLVLATATSGQMLLKFLIGNILEVKLIERDREMNIHPVWIILGLSYFGYIWGPTGALLSVPIMAMVKTAALSVRGEVLDTSTVGPALAEALLACFEGRQPCWARPDKEASCASPMLASSFPAMERPPPPLFMPPPSSPTTRFADSPGGRGSPQAVN
mmetsp:Transcript_119928/g.382864  ORF Transcript_119928/g.382864 Transcript_119928/m.382864 type:complete len:526 (+) Transcript_119928:188-1765(+)